MIPDNLFPILTACWAGGWYFHAAVCHNYQDLTANRSRYTQAHNFLSEVKIVFPVYIIHDLTTLNIICHFIVYSVIFHKVFVLCMLPSHLLPRVT